MKHKFAFKMTLWWLIVLLILGSSLLLFGEKEDRESLLENRMLAGFPDFSFKSVFTGEFMSGFENYLSDSFFGRSDLVSLSSDVMGIFSSQSTEDLLTMDIGEDIEGEFDQREEEEEAAPAPAQEAAPAPVSQPVQPQQTDPAQQTQPGAELSAQVSVGSSLNTRDETYEPLDEYNFWMLLTDGGKQLVYSYSPHKIKVLMDGLNAYRAVLPEDGTVHFALVPVAQSANWWTRNTNKFCGWESNAEEYMAALAADGVYIYNGPELLAPGLAAGDYMYYRTDHHWTPRGAYAVASAMLKNQGLPVTRFNDYQYKVNKGFLGSIYSENPTAALKAMADDIEIPSSLAPVHSYVVRQLNKEKELEYMANYSNYLAYLQGTQTPFRRIDTGFSTGRTALLISDSFGNCFAPFLVPYYDQVCMVDLRKGNFTSEAAGYSLGEYMEYYGVDDVYVVLSTASGLNYNYTQEYLLKYLH